MDMNYIRMTAEVTVQACVMIVKRIFLIIEDDIVLEYVGGYDFSQVACKVRMGQMIILGVDPSFTYCALVDDVAKQHLR